MSRVYKKVLGVVGLALVAGITALAAGIPPLQDAAAQGSEIGISVTIISESLYAQITGPADGSIFYDHSDITGLITYNGLGTIRVRLADPSNAIIYDGPYSVDGSDTISQIFDNLSEYGKYTLSMEARDQYDALVGSDAIVFYYQSITVDNPEDSTILVDFGSAVCKLRFQVYDITDIDRENPRIDYILDDLSAATGTDPRQIEVEIPGFSALPGETEYTVVVTSYDCSPSGLPLEEAEVSVETPMPPPDTGSISVLGLTISRVDYVVTGVLVFFSAVIFAFFLLRRKKDQRRR